MSNLMYQDHKLCESVSREIAVIVYKLISQGKFEAALKIVCVLDEYPASIQEVEKGRFVLHRNHHLRNLQGYLSSII